MPAGWLFMTYNQAKHCSAMTAIAAVLALSSAPLLAQEAGVPDSAPETTEPVTAAPDPLAAEPAAPEVPAPTDTASQPAKTSKPVAKTKAAARQSTQATRTSLARSSTATTAPAPIASPTAGESIDATVAPPVEAAPAPAQSAAETGALDQAQQMDMMLEAAGAGLVALLAGGVALRSRKRRKEEERIEEAKWAIIEALPDPETQVEREPAFARPAALVHDAVPATPATGAARTGAPVTRLPNGFDLSRFGPHVQAAYRGPTPDNPSLSLKYRLRRAGALDQQARQAANQAATRPAAQAPARPAWAQPAQTGRNEAKFMLRRAGTNNDAKPVFQR